VDAVDPNVAELLGLDPADPEIAALAAATDRDMDLIERLVQVRHDRGLTQRDVAERMGRSQPNVSAFERTGGDPHLSTIRRYAAAVGASVRWHVVVEGGATRISFPTSAVRGDVSDDFYRVAR
jgi:transcriptional regulator with XRE-family HTH domain